MKSPQKLFDLDLALKTHPASVVPVLRIFGDSTPRLINKALRCALSKLKPELSL